MSNIRTQIEILIQQRNISEKSHVTFKNTKTVHSIVTTNRGLSNIGILIEIGMEQSKRLRNCHGTI